MNNLAVQLIKESGVFSSDEEKWISIVLRLSRSVIDFIKEENEEGKGQLISLSSFGSVSEPSTQGPSSSGGLFLVPTSPTTSESLRSLLSPEPREVWNESLKSLDSIVNVLEIEGSLPEQSVFVDGYMMKKNLAHKV